MNIVYLLLPLALLLSLSFLVTFICMVVRGQFEDLDTPPQRMLLDDDGWQMAGDGRKTQY